MLDLWDRMSGRKVESGGILTGLDAALNHLDLLLHFNWVGLLERYPLIAKKLATMKCFILNLNDFHFHKVKKAYN